MAMDSKEVERLRSAICRMYKDQPHKRKYWLALLAKQSNLEGTPDDPSLSRRGLASKRRAELNRAAKRDAQP
jgi:hypothetical protein